MIASVRLSPKGLPYAPTPIADSQSRDHDSTTIAMASRLSCSEEHDGEEAATPGQPVALARVFWKFSPRQFSCENYRIPLALPQYPASSETLTFR
jgi:hypothetical protein